MAAAAPVAPVPVAEAVDAALTAPSALLALGMPGCAACEVLPASLGEIARVRPGLAVHNGRFGGPEDWALRETLLWPLGIHPTRAVVPMLVLLRDGRPIAQRHGSLPAAGIDAWLAEALGPAQETLPAEPTALERDALAAQTSRRVRQIRVRDR